MIRFICRNPGAELTDDRLWEGKAENVRKNNGTVEMDVSGKGSHMHVIVGEYASGNYVCIPDRGIGSALATLDDRFWNRERLSMYIGSADAITLSEALNAMMMDGLA